MLCSIAGVGLEAHTGDVVDLDPGVAARLIERRRAEPIQAGPDTTAAAPALETAARPPARPRSRRKGRTRAN